MAKKRSVSTSRADRADDKRKRDANKAESKRNSRKRDLAIAAAGGAGALAAKSAAGKAKIYRHNMRTSVNQTMKERPFLDRKEVKSDYRKTSAKLAMKNMITTGKNAEPRPFEKKSSSFSVKPASRVSNRSVVRDLNRMSTKDLGKVVKENISKQTLSRYARLTGGGGAPGLGRGQGGRGGGGGFLSRGK